MRHQALEEKPLLAAVAGPALTRAVLGSFLRMLHAFYQGLEPALLLALQSRTQPHIARLYRPRQALIAADLRHLGLAIPEPARISAYPSSTSGLLGVIYAVEGSALGGQVISRQIGRMLGDTDAGSIRSFDRLAEGIGTHWQAVLGSLREAMKDETSIAEVVAGASAVFETLGQLAEHYGQEVRLPNQ